MHRIRTETIQTSKNAELHGTELLRINRSITIFEAIRDEFNNKLISRKIIGEKIEPLEFELTEVTEKELEYYRLNEIPSFVLKIDGKLLYTSIPDDINFLMSDMLGNHKCAHKNKTCKRLSAASDENGGCQKVRNTSRCIEKYPWITVGYESFNTKVDAFVVIECQKYQ